MTILKNFQETDYDALCTFLAELNRQDPRHINWNWARLEWMYAHPEFDKEAVNSIGTWWEDGRIVAAAVYDLYFGEGFCGVLPEYADLRQEVLAYAEENLRDDSGFALAVCDDCEEEREAVLARGYEPEEQTETILAIDLTHLPEAAFPSGIHPESLNPAREPERFQWILWQGFDHGTDYETFRREDPIVPQYRPNLREELSLAAVDSSGKDAAYCCLWYREGTDYAYVEPVCTVPGHRGKGIGKALVLEALHRAQALGAKRAYVISDQVFYEKLGFRRALHYTFYRKN